MKINIPIALICIIILISNILTNKNKNRNKNHNKNKNKTHNKGKTHLKTIAKEENPGVNGFGGDAFAQLRSLNSKSGPGN